MINWIPKDMRQLRISKKELRQAFDALTSETMGQIIDTMVPLLIICGLVFIGLIFPLGLNKGWWTW